MYKVRLVLAVTHSQGALLIRGKASRPTDQPSDCVDTVALVLEMASL
jgi:hypothetical protein